jgi:hypothetical protein
MLIVYADEVIIPVNLRLCWPDPKINNHNLDDEKALIANV